MWTMLRSLERLQVPSTKLRLEATLCFPCHVTLLGDSKHSLLGQLCSATRTKCKPKSGAAPRGDLRHPGLGPQQRQRKIY